MPAKTTKKEEPQEEAENKSASPKVKDEEKTEKSEKSVLIPDIEEKVEPEKTSDAVEKEEKEEVKAEEEEELKVEEAPKVKEEKKVPKVSSFSMLDTKGADTKETKSVDDVEEEDAQEEPEEQVEEEAEEKSEEPKTKVKKDEISSDEVKKWLKDIKPDTTKEVEKKGGPGFKTIFIFVIILAVVAAVVGGVLYYRSGTTKVTEETPSETTTEEEKPTEALSPTPEEVDLSTLTISILNGTGIVGEATKVGDLLEEGDFGQINTGNAESYDFESTSVSMKENIPNSVFDKLRELLAEDYAVIKSEESLEEDSTYDIIIIVGVSKE